MGRKEVTTKKIIEAAISEFNACGYEGANTNRIAERAGVSKGVIFLHFKTKDNLYVACLQRILNGFSQSVADLDLVKIEDIFQRLEVFANWKTNFFVSRKEQAKFVYNCHYALSSNKEIARKAAPMLQEYMKTLSVDIMEFDFDPTMYKEGITKEKVKVYLEVIIAGLNARFDKAMNFEDFPMDKLIEEYKGMIQAIKYGILR
ncbi:MAG: TetR/AcrR family transcriptional regulator [Clostridia bacterium]|nr:TetR/AcrR family transcriptional regulator [Clostridia bacterium]